MSLIQRLFKRSSPEPTTPAFDTYYDRLTGFPGVAGVDVNTTTAEGISAVYACVAAISETVGSLPLDVYRNTDNGREKAKTHPLYRLLHDAPNNYQTALGSASRCSVMFCCVVTPMRKSCGTRTAR